MKLNTKFNINDKVKTPLSKYQGTIKEIIISHQVKRCSYSEPQEFYKVEIRTDGDTDTPSSYEIEYIFHANELKAW